MAEPIAQIGTLVEFIFTILIFSFIWRENMGYRIAEHIFVGVSAGYMVVLALKSVYNVGYLGIVEKQQYGMIIAIILGLMLYLRYSKSTEIYYRTPIALLIGLGTSLSMRGGIDAMFLKQIRATIIPLNTFDNVVLVFGTIFSLYYFFFTTPRGGAIVEAPAKLGRYVMMLGFGASYAGTIMSRLALFIDRLNFLLSVIMGG